MIKEPLTQEDIENAATESRVIENGILHSELSPYYEKGFKDGAEWRINSVWHDCNDISAATNNKDEVVLLLENGKLVEYEDNWEEYYSPVLKWAYKKDLLPNKED